MLQFLVKTKLMLLPWPSTDRRTFTLLKSSTSDFYYHTDTSTAIGTGKKCIQWDFVLMLFSAKTKLMQIEKALNWPKNTLLKSLTLDLFFHLDTSTVLALAPMRLCTDAPPLLVDEMSFNTNYFSK